MKKQISILFTLLILLTIQQAQAAEEKKQGPPPSPVVVAKTVNGTVTPTTKFVGTVEFDELSSVATEVGGIVSSYTFDIGDKVRKGQVLVRLNTGLLQRKLESDKALLEQSRTNLEEAQKDYDRMKRLFEGGTVSEQDYDKRLFLVRSLTRRVGSLEANVQYAKLQIAKATLRAPFDGVVVKRHVDLGEWLNVGDALAEIGRTDTFDVIVHVPQESLAYIKKGMQVDVSLQDRTDKGTITAIVPYGDVATRTFPIRITVQDNGFMAHGMEARVTLPAGPDTQAVVVPRDAVISVFGTLAVFTVSDGTANMIPVEIIGYKGMTAGVRGPGLASGMDVVVKGNERLRPGQAVMPKPAE